MDRSLRLLKAAQRQALLLVVLISLLAFVANALILQTHRHFDHRAMDVAHHVAASSAPDVSVLSADDPCALCDALAFAGPYLQPTETAIAGRLSAPFPTFRRITRSLQIAARSHDWHSRAPPMFRLT